jgi:hypothetical protein
MEQGGELVGDLLLQVLVCSGVAIQAALQAEAL